MARSVPHRTHPGRPRSPNPTAGGFAALLLLAVALVGCFEDPVEENVHLELRRDGAVEITARTRIPEAHLDGDNARLAHRLRQRQQAMAEGWDGWPARFEAAGPWDQVTFHHHRRGELIETARRGVFRRPAAVERFFADRVNATYAWDDEAGVGEIAFYPTAGGPATGGEIRQVEAAMDAWSAAAADYLAAVGHLYAHLQLHPQDADPAFRLLFADLLAEKNRDALRRRLGADALSRVDRVDDAMGALLSILVVPDDDAFTLNELSRRVYDPFPGHLTVAAPAGRVLAAEGFVQRDGRWHLPSHDLWSAFEALEGRWIAPDPAAAYVAASLAGGEIDLSTWSATDLHAARAPTPAELRGALEAGLTPEPVYRLRWSLAG